MTDVPGKPLDLMDHSLYPFWPILMDPDGGVNLAPQRDDTSGGFLLCVEGTASTKGPYDIEIPMGNLRGAPEDVEEYSKILTSFLDGSHRRGAVALLTLAPYWIDRLYRREGLLRGTVTNSFERKLIAYRLADICLWIIDNWPKGQEALQDSRVLIVRQHYRYLASMADIYVDSPNERKLPKYSLLLRQAREEYARVILYETSLLNFALGAATPMDSHTQWDLDAEVDILLYRPGGRHLWPFAMQDAQHRLITDQLLQKWILAHDDLPGIIRVLKSIFIRQGELEKQKGRQRVNWLLAFGYNWLHAAYIFGTVLFLFAVFWGVDNRQVWPAYAAFGATIGPPILLFVLSGRFSPRYIRPMLFYPLTLRVPAMSLVGLLAIAGLADAFIRFGFNGLDQQKEAIVILIGAYGASLAYIIFEVSARTFSKKTRGRAGAIWAYCWACSIWLATLGSWLADPLGLSINANKVIDFSRGMIFFGNRISLDFILLISALTLLVGVFTQIFWEDRAIAEPL